MATSVTPLTPMELLSAAELEELSETTKASARLRECKFVDPFPDEVQTECSICIQILKDPQIMSCCGHRFCLECIKRVTCACPLCKAIEVKYYPDKTLERQINQRKVFCLLRKDGCFWTGELSKLHDHFDFYQINENSNPCQFFPVRCTYCNEHVRRKDMEDHETRCELRPLSCKFCGYVVGDENLKNHYKKCPACPVYCTNFECSKVVTRWQLDRHLMICEWSLLDCKYQHAGCSMKVFRKDMESHLEKYTQKHLDLLNLKCERLEDLEEQNEKNCCALQEKLDELEEEVKSKGQISFLVILDLPEDAHDEQKLKSRFGQYGQVANIHLLDSSLKAGIVVYSSPASYKKVIKSKSNGIKLCKELVQATPVYTTQAEEESLEEDSWRNMYGF